MDIVHSLSASFCTLMGSLRAKAALWSKGKTDDSSNEPLAECKTSDVPGS